MNETQEDRLIREALREAQKGPVARAFDRLRSLLTPRIAFAVALVMLCGWFFRWEAIPVSGGEGSGHLYMHNRLTGSIYFVGGDSRIPVKDLK
jgi:hypothetical protein